MLGRGHERRLIEELWDLTESKVQLPEQMACGFLDSRGPAALYYDDRRGFQRYFLRSKAVLKRSGEKFGAYSKDVSRSGVGFLSPVQLMPMEKVHLSLASAEIVLEVSRCRRVDQACFECGGRFAL